MSIYRLLWLHFIDLTQLWVNWSICGTWTEMMNISSVIFCISHTVHFGGPTSAPEPRVWDLCWGWTHLWNECLNHNKMVQCFIEQWPKINAIIHCWTVTLFWPHQFYPHFSHFHAATVAKAAPLFDSCSNTDDIKHLKAQWSSSLDDFTKQENSVISFIVIVPGTVLPRCSVGVYYWKCSDSKTLLWRPDGETNIQTNYCSSKT